MLRASGEPVVSAGSAPASVCDVLWMVAWYPWSEVEVLSKSLWTVPTFVVSVPKCKASLVIRCRVLEHQHVFFWRYWMVPVILVLSRPPMSSHLQ